VFGECWVLHKGKTRYTNKSATWRRATAATLPTTASPLLKYPACEGDSQGMSIWTPLAWLT